jgi:hypothetical protein
VVGKEGREAGREAGREGKGSTVVGLDPTFWKERRKE